MKKIGFFGRILSNFQDFRRKNRILPVSEFMNQFLDLKRKTLSLRVRIYACARAYSLFSVKIQSARVEMTSFAPPLAAASRLLASLRSPSPPDSVSTFTSSSHLHLLPSPPPLPALAERFSVHLYYILSIYTTYILYFEWP